MDFVLTAFSALLLSLDTVPSDDTNPVAGTGATGLPG